MKSILKEGELPIEIGGILFRQTESVGFRVLVLKKGAHCELPFIGTMLFVDRIEDCVYRNIEKQIGWKGEDIVGITHPLFYFTSKENSLMKIILGVELDLGKDMELSNKLNQYKWVEVDEAIDLAEDENTKEAFRKFEKKFMK